MENLFSFFKDKAPFFVWLILAMLSLTLLGRSNPYQRSVILGSANRVVGVVYEMTDGVVGYFGLRDINEELLARTGQLEAENLRLRQIIQAYEDQQYIATDTVTQYRYTVAHVINNSVIQAENYITLDRGRADGIRPDLGVADQNGVVGIVAQVSDHYAVVLSVLNPKSALSVMLKDSENFGSLVWGGGSPAYALLKDLPRNVRFSAGDTVVTTGYTSSFPKGVPVGRVVEAYDQAGDNNFLTLRVRLFTDFNRINDVHVISNESLDEQRQLEQAGR